MADRNADRKRTSSDPSRAAADAVLNASDALILRGLELLAAVRFDEFDQKDLEWRRQLLFDQAARLVQGIEGEEMFSSGVLGIAADAIVVASSNATQATLEAVGDHKWRGDLFDGAEAAWHKAAAAREGFRQAVSQLLDKSGLPRLR